jgi:hypothetical protein
MLHIDKRLTTSGINQKKPSNKSDNKHVKNKVIKRDDKKMQTKMTMKSKRFKTNQSVETFTKKQIVSNNVEEHNYNRSKKK